MNLYISFTDSEWISLISSKVQSLGSQSNTKKAVSHWRWEGVFVTLKVSFRQKDTFLSLQNDWTKFFHDCICVSASLILNHVTIPSRQLILMMVQWSLTTSRTTSMELEWASWDLRWELPSLRYPFNLSRGGGVALIASRILLKYIILI